MKEMTESRAREILRDTIRPDDGLVNGHNYTNWFPGDDRITLDGAFLPDELQAIAWWMQNKRQSPASS